MTNYLFHRFKSLEYKIHNEDEKWEFTEEPHSTRRKEILKKYPQIKKLMGPDPTIAYVVVAEVIAQVFFAWLLSEANWATILICGYVISATLNHSLGSAIHEIGHNLAFGHGRPLMNRALGIVSNLPMVVPISISYKKYHTDHHRFLGHENMDVDIPTKLEAWLFQRWYTKMIWLLIHPILHGIRPFWKSPKPVLMLEVINAACQLVFDMCILLAFGHKALTYLLLGTFFGLGFHPLAGHFISEHYLFNKGQATHSYYGPLNAFLFNVGYHVEHHDFPYISYHKLPEVKRIAAEYYDNLPYHTSWLKVLFDFIFDDTMGPKSRGVGFLKEDVATQQKLLKEEEQNDKNSSNGISNGSSGISNGANGIQKKNGISNGVSNGHTISNGHTNGSIPKND